MESEVKKDVVGGAQTAMERDALAQKARAEAELRASGLRLQGVELFLQAEKVSYAYSEVSFMKDRIKVRNSWNPMRGEHIQFAIDMAAADLQLALSELRKEEGGIETEMYRCLSEYCANLYAISLRVKPRNSFQS